MSDPLASAIGQTERSKNAPSNDSTPPDYQVVADWLAAIGYGIDFTSDVPLPEPLRWPLAHAHWRIDNINGDPTPQSYYDLIAEECGW